ncbi:DNA-binding response regulator [Sphingomonas koreensis]|nr:DNA-binding response regulator [Sphingomonas koreensis]
MRLLLVEDEPDMSRLIAAALRSDGLAVDVVGTLAMASEAIKLIRYPVVVLDRRLPDGDGISLLLDVKPAVTGTAVLVLSALDGPAHVIEGLDAGACDYLGKPFDVGELRARVRVALRGAGDPSEPNLRCGNVVLDIFTRNILVGEHVLRLKRREVGLLESLIRRCGRVVPREVLLDEMFGFDDDIQSNTLDAHVSRLRARMRAAGSTASIETLRGLGYALRDGRL